MWFRTQQMSFFVQLKCDSSPSHRIESPSLVLSAVSLRLMSVMGGLFWLTVARSNEKRSISVERQGHAAVDGKADPWKWSQNVLSSSCFLDVYVLCVLLFALRLWVCFGPGPALAPPPTLFTCVLFLPGCFLLSSLCSYRPCVSAVFVDSPCI